MGRLGYTNVAAFLPYEKGQAALAWCLLAAIRQSGNCNGPSPESSQCECLIAASYSTPGGPPIEVFLAGLRPTSRVTISWHSARRVLGRPIADASGRVSFLVRSPLTSALGPHVLEITGRRANGSKLELRRTITLRPASAYVLHPPASARADNHYWLAGLAAGALLVLAAGAVALACRRRQ